MSPSQRDQTSPIYLAQSCHPPAIQGHRVVSHDTQMFEPSLTNLFKRSLYEGWTVADMRQTQLLCEKMPLSDEGHYDAACSIVILLPRTTSNPSSMRQVANRTRCLTCAPQHYPSRPLLRQRETCNCRSGAGWHRLSGTAAAGRGASYCSCVHIMSLLHSCAGQRCYRRPRTTPPHNMRRLPTEYVMSSRARRFLSRPLPML